MGQPIHYPIRERIVLLRFQGHSIKEISTELQLSFWTIRHLLRANRDGALFYLRQPTRDLDGADGATAQSSVS